MKTVNIEFMLQVLGQKTVEIEILRQQIQELQQREADRLAEQHIDKTDE
jgi:hypothetical protein